MTLANPTPEELLAWCGTIMGQFDPNDYVYIVARALKERIQSPPPSVPADREIGPSNIQERFRFFVTKPAWKSTDTWDAARQQIRDDMLEETHAMLRALKSPPSEVRKAALEEAAKALDILSQHYKNNYGDVGVAHDRAATMVRALATLPTGAQE